MAEERIVSVEGKSVYRADKYVVASVDWAVFPNRCVLTNEPVDSPKLKFREKMTPKAAKQMADNASYLRSFAKSATLAGAGIAAAPVAAVAMVAAVASMETIKLQIGLNEKMLQAYLRRRKLGLGLIFGGIIAFLCVACAAPFAEDLGLPSGRSTSQLMSVVVPITLGMVPFSMVVIGFMYIAFGAKPVLKIVGLDSRYVWLEGAHPDFIAALPELPPDDHVPAATQAKYNYRIRGLKKESTPPPGE
jgi:hypothetical protein